MCRARMERAGRCCLHPRRTSEAPFSRAVAAAHGTFSMKNRHADQIPAPAQWVRARHGGGWVARLSGRPCAALCVVTTATTFRFACSPRYYDLPDFRRRQLLVVHRPPLARLGELKDHLRRHGHQGLSFGDVAGDAELCAGGDASAASAATCWRRPSFSAHRWPCWRYGLQNVGYTHRLLLVQHARGSRRALSSASHAGRRTDFRVGRPPPAAATAAASRLLPNRSLTRHPSSTCMFGFVALPTMTSRASSAASFRAAAHPGLAREGATARR